MQVPKLVKICLNQGVGNAVADKKLIDAALSEMSYDCRTESSTYCI